MSASFELDTREFQAALQTYFKTTSKTLPEILNQRAFNIAARSMDMLKPRPGAEDSQRKRVRTYLREPINTRIKLAKSGKRKGKFVRRGSLHKGTLRREHLIVQARRREQGKKGLYGARMRREAGIFTRRAASSVGFLKSPFIPVIKGLLAFVKFRRVKTRWGKISVWDGGHGFGRVNPAKRGFDPFVAMQHRWQIAVRESGKIKRRIERTVQRAFNMEAREMVDHVARKMQKDADQHNRR